MLDGLDIPSRIHLNVEGSCGGTTFALTMAKNSLIDGGRVLWVSPEFPDETRFSQIFAEVDITSSTRFHAVNLVGKLEQTVDSLTRLAGSLPNVTLIVIDDWCEKQGKIPISSISAMQKLSKSIPEEIVLVLITKLGTNVSGGPEFNVRGEKAMLEAKFSICQLTKQNNSSKRTFRINEESFELLIEDSGFKVVA